MGSKRTAASPGVQLGRLNNIVAAKYYDISQKNCVPMPYCYCLYLTVLYLYYICESWFERQWVGCMGDLTVHTKVGRMSVFMGVGD